MLIHMRIRFKIVDFSQAPTNSVSRIPQIYFSTVCSSTSRRNTRHYRTTFKQKIPRCENQNRENHIVPFSPCFRDFIAARNSRVAKGFKGRRKNRKKIEQT